MNPFLSQIFPFAFNFAPRGWAYCDGQILPIAQNQSLFSLLGTIYGGDGRTTFALPDLRGRFPIGYGTDNFGNDYSQGQRLGQETVTLTASQMPSHKHSIKTDNEFEGLAPVGNHLGSTPNYSPGGATSSQVFKNGTIAVAGGGQAHQNMPPFQTINWCIALQGIFPSRS